MLKQIRYFFGQLKRVKEFEKKRNHLEYLLESLDSNWPLLAKIEWLIRLLSWVRYENSQDANLVQDMGRVPQVRIKFFLKVLDRRPEWKLKVSQCLTDVLASVDGFELFCETGLAKERGLFSEIKERLLFKVLPEAPLDEDFAALISALFPTETDAKWLQMIDDETADRLLSLVADKNLHTKIKLRKDLEDALLYLGSQVKAMGLSHDIRRRVDNRDLRTSSFYHLTEEIESFVRKGTAQSGLAKSLIPAINSCYSELESVYLHLNESGVSVQIVFQTSVIKEYLARIRILSLILSSEKVSSRLVVDFLAKLVADISDMKSLKSLWAQNAGLLAQKIVDRTAESGEHYITRDRKEYFEMFRAAAGGGAVTAATVYLKVLVGALGLSGFLTGIFAALNYSLSFVGIHLLGFTLGTKQPAMTAPALAKKLEAVGVSENGVSDLVNEISLIIRSQVASIFGNVFMVVPVALFATYLVYVLFGFHLMPAEKAQAALKDVQILSFVPIYAAFTGVLLWSSSMIAGWVDNWFAFRGLRRRIAKNRTFVAAFGKVGARKISLFFQDNISAIAGNAGLGILLGLAPEFMKFLGIPLDVRHITLSSGTLAAALPVLGWQVLQSWDFLGAVLGLVLIASLNVGVSFALAFSLAIRARGITTLQRDEIYKIFWQQFFARPRDFFFPKKEFGPETPRK